MKPARRDRSKRGRDLFVDHFVVSVRLFTILTGRARAGVLLGVCHTLTNTETYGFKRVHDHVYIPLSRGTANESLKRINKRRAVPTVYAAGAVFRWPRTGRQTRRQ